jgi:eukaryotic-like serine/threonine-protein kinase
VTPEVISHYRLVCKLGEGGMGEVYLADDVTLGRPVALKLLPLRVMANPVRVRRFEQEARAVGALNHPNILTIYEIGQVQDEAGARHFMAMEYVEGQTLRHHLSSRRFRLEEALEIAAQIGSALMAAHGAGITHRDIKPDNVMLRDDGVVKVLDFGLAKLTERRVLRSDPAVTQAETVDETSEVDVSPAIDQQLTTPGALVGTVRYMSPEQARGLVVDARTDIFSLGIVLYEMLAGRSPFQGATSMDTMVAILDRDPPPLTRYAPEIPDELTAIVNKALAKDRDARYQSAKSLMADLKRMEKRLWVAEGLAPASDSGSRGGDWVVPRRDSSQGSGGPAHASGGSSSMSHRPPIDSLAVLPFFTTSADANAAYLAEGIPESLILNLSRLSQLRVMAWSTVARFRGQEADAIDVGRTLGVRAIFAGRMYQFADNLVIRTELVDAGDGSQIWGAQFQRKLDDLLSIDQDISQEICEHLRVRLNEDERERLARRYTQNAAAYQAYLKGRYYWNQRTARSLKKAIESFEEAITLDDRYALAYAGLSDCYGLVSIYGTAPPKATMPRAKAAALKALEIDDGLAEAHTSLGAALVWFDWDWRAGERAFQRAIELNPAYAVAHHWYACVLLCAERRFDEALASQQRALELEPLSLIVNSSVGFICYQAHRFDQAIDALLKTLEMDEMFTYARFHLGLTYAHLGRFDEAIAQLRRTIDMAGGRGSLLYAALGYAYGVAGRRDEAHRILRDLQTSPLNRDVSPFYLAMIHAGLDEHEAAIKCLASAIDDRFHWVVWLQSEPVFARLHGRGGFVELTRRIGLPDREARTI